MKRPSILKSQRRRTLSNSDKGDRWKPSTFRRMKAYIPHTRVEKLKMEKIPRSLPNKLVIVSNYEGNGFRNHTKDIEMFDAGLEVREEIKSCVKRLNEETYRVWVQKKTPLQLKKFRPQKLLMYFQLLLVFVLTLAFVQFNEVQANYRQTTAICLFAVICVISVVAIIIGFSSVFKKYCEDSLQTDTKNAIRRLLFEFNQSYFAQRKLVWKAHIDYLWVSLNYIESQQNDQSSADRNSPRKHTEQSLNP